MKAVYWLLVMCALLLVCFFLLQAHIDDAAPKPTATATADTGVPAARAPKPTVRRPAVAGAFYPDDPAKLASMVDGYLADVPDQKLQGTLVALVSPHAGYVYSGPVAAYGFAAAKGKSYDTAVVVGPSHGARFSGAALSASDYWETPLGKVAIDRELGRELSALDSRFHEDDRAQADEHSLEVQLPFLQRTLKGFKLLPIQIADFSPRNLGAIAQALATALKGHNILLIASTDLSHYPAYDDARRVDGQTLDLIRDWKLKSLMRHEDASSRSGVPRLSCALCGLGPVVVVMDAAQRLGANHAEVLKYANSGDSPVGDKNRCVGYGALALCAVDGKPKPKVETYMEARSENDEERFELSEGELNEEQQKYLLSLARRTINDWVTKRERVVPERRDGVFAEKRAVFVTINENGALRGCIGSLVAQEPLADAVVSRAIAASTEDPRFRPVERGELPDLELHVSVLSPMKPIDDASQIELGKHGVVVRQGYRSGVFLPEVAPEQGWDLETTLKHLCEGKAGLPADAWKKGAQLSVFTTQNFGDAG